MTLPLFMLVTLFFLYIYFVTYFLTTHHSLMTCPLMTCPLFAAYCSPKAVLYCPTSSIMLFHCSLFIDSPLLLRAIVLVTYC